MHRPCLSWVLSLLLVLTQHGAVLHELGHLSHGGGHTAGTTLCAELQPLEGDQHCPTCEAFAQIVNPATAAAPDVPVCPAGFLPTPDLCYSIVGAAAPTPRSRGPPQI
jgi:hypothetical protein